MTLASLLAGFVDAIVGGGGLVMVPALFAAFPGAPPATLLGTNKAASVWGTAMATWQYSRKVQIRWSAMLPAAAAGFAGSFVGAWAVTVVSADFLRKLLPLVLLGVLLYTLAKKELGRHHTPRFAGRAEVIAACLIGVLIGFYDGFFGPGTGSFFVFLFVRLLGYDFLNASASAKLLNLASNEYFSAVKRSTLNARIINTEFKDLKNGQHKIISFYAKKARGMMSRFVIKERINNPEHLKQFDAQGYRFSAEQSKPDLLVFLRDHAPQ